MPLLAGVAIALLVYGSFLFARSLERDQLTQQAGLQSVHAARANMDALWDKAAELTEHIARQLSGADKARLPAILTRYNTLWPEAGLALYDARGEDIALSALAGAGDAKNSAGPVPHTARDMVHRALIGQTAKDLTLFRGFLSLSAAAPIRNSEAKALALSAPLDSFFLSELKRRSQADIAVLPFDEVSNAILSGGAVNTFMQPGGRNAAAWEALAAQLTAAPPAAALALPFGDDAYAGVMPLSGARGHVAGLLIAVPALEVQSASQHMPVLFSLAVGLAAALLTAYFLHKRNQHLVSAVAGAVSSLADNRNGLEHLWNGEAWPLPLQAAMERVFRRIQECRLRLHRAERDREEAGRAQENAVQATSAQDHNQYARLFTNAPFGIFQMEKSGRFIRVNPVFALLLGYDSPVHLLSECSDLQELFLYGDEIRNPLGALLGQGIERHLVSLRRRDGKVRHFSLEVLPIPSATGDDNDGYEGFLLDRESEDLIARANRDRDFALRESVSLALLLAAICRQATAYLGFSKGPAARAVDLAPGMREPFESGERRQSVLSIKAILDDIYQIAVAEAEAQPQVPLPIVVGSFFARLCRQTLPAVHSRGISLRCEIAEELPERFSGPAPMLRHALQRALLAVASPVRGGWACLSVTRDPNAPKTPGQTRVLLSASWSSYARDCAPGSASPFAPEEAIGERCIAFDAPADLGAYGEGDELDAGVLDIWDEQEVLRYLAQKMRGELLESVFTNTLRSIQLIVTLNHLCADDDDGAMPTPGGAHPDAMLPPASPEAAPGDASSRDDDYSEVDLADLHPESAQSSLELILISKEPGQGDLYPEARPERDELGLNILLVDNSLNNRLLFSLFLRESSHRITEAQDGQEGVEIFQHGNFDVIFLDMEMPLMDGYQATRIIRALEAETGRAPTPIVAMTSYALPEFRQQCLLAGCSDFLTKPLSKVALFSLLDALADMRQDKMNGAL